MRAIATEFILSALSMNMYWEESSKRPEQILFSKYEEGPKRASEEIGFSFLGRTFEKDEDSVEAQLSVTG